MDLKNVRGKDTRYALRQVWDNTQKVRTELHAYAKHMDNDTTKMRSNMKKEMKKMEERLNSLEVRLLRIEDPYSEIKKCIEYRICKGVMFVRPKDYYSPDYSLFEFPPSLTPNSHLKFVVECNLFYPNNNPVNTVPQTYTKWIEGTQLNGIQWVSINSEHHLCIDGVGMIRELVNPNPNTMTMMCYGDTYVEYDKDRYYSSNRYGLSSRLSGLFWEYVELHKERIIQEKLMYPCVFLSDGFF